MNPITKKLQTLGLGHAMTTDTRDFLRPWPALNATVTGSQQLSLIQVAQLSGVAAADLQGLLEYGVLQPTDSEALPQTFDIGCVLNLQRAEQLRLDLALDGHGFALALMFFNRIAGVEAELRGTRAELRRCRADAPLEAWLD